MFRRNTTAPPKDGAGSVKPFGKKRTTKWIIRDEWWDGYWAGVQGGRSERVLSYMELPRWCDDVARIAYRAGYAEAKRQIEKGESTRFVLPRRPQPSAATLVECYAAAGLVKTR